jgi:hypothetical protein
MGANETDSDLIDKLSLQQRLEFLRTKAQKEELTVDEIREIISISYSLRRTTAGPAKAKKPTKGKKSKSAPLTDAELDKLF